MWASPHVTQHLADAPAADFEGFEKALIVHDKSEKVVVSGKIPRSKARTLDQAEPLQLSQPAGDLALTSNMIGHGYIFDAVIR